MKYNISKKNNYELQYHYDIRKKFIHYLNPKSKKDLILYDNLSHIFINIIFLKCSYNFQTEKLVFDIAKKIKEKDILELLPKNYHNLTIKDLKELLKKKKLPINGKKKDLINRLAKS